MNGNFPQFFTDYTPDSRFIQWFLVFFYVLPQSFRNTKKPNYISERRAIANFWKWPMDGKINMENSVAIQLFPSRNVVCQLVGGKVILTLDFG